MDTIPLFVDSNAFIQLRDLKDIPWSKVFPAAKRIDLVVTPPVIKELEGMKTGPNERRRDRARAALALVDHAMEEEGSSIKLRPDRPEVWLKVAHRVKVDWDQFDHLDRMKTDDELVVLAALHGSGATLFTHDRGPRISARTLGIPTLKPENDWLLPPEKSDKDRKIEQLERAARERHPSILLTVGKDAQDGRIEMPLLRVPPLNPAEIQLKVESVLRENPKANVRGSSASDFLTISSIGGITDNDVHNYHRQYDRYEQDLNKYFERLHVVVGLASRMTTISYTVKNDSGVTAPGLRIEYSILGDGFLKADAEDAYEIVSRLCPFPRPPKPPMPRSLFNHPFRPALTFPRADERDPVGFYWVDRPGSSDKRGALQCQDFRARRLWEDEIFVVFPKGTKNGSIRLDVQASNLPAPVSSSVAYELVERDSNWDDPIVMETLRRALVLESEDD
ncbi:PIN domain-containing protein [Phyllobacterium zundukense]|uniref:PIN domain-containing protein n=1 Tax=Phyllobacterium zundukense TaxID=1867719 RepID=A0A2N9VT44_9HYPH|nr:PIN domain-containing protein [Phyllobacterium zundukense]ATU95423.1 hypothetical protein BLM14_27450 [Phyllobacterium zundukense]PIO42662.1 hypothetical protein B5P45_22115 [Phyllobacterium zundukense]